MLVVATACASSEPVEPVANQTLPTAPTAPSAPTVANETTETTDTAPTVGPRQGGEPAATPTKVRENPSETASQPDLDHQGLDRAELGTSAPDSGDIRDVDFFNGFVYPATFDEEVAVTVNDGEYIDEPGYLWFWVFDIEYGDLDGDGTDEAVVQTGFNTGGSGQFGRLAVWDLVDGRVVERGWVGTGDRADGGLWHFEIRDGLLVTENFLTDQGACCPNMLTQQRLALVSDGFVHVEHIEPLRWMSLHSYDDPDTEMKFLPGTSAAVIQLSSADVTNNVIFEAGVGQWVTLSRRRGPEVGVVIFDETGVAVGQSANTSLELELPSSGFFRVVFTNDLTADSSTIVDVAITGTPLPAAPTWAPAVRELIVVDEPMVSLLTMTPEFDLSDSGTLNAAVDRWMGDQTDWWVADVIEFPPLERNGDDSSTGGEYELLYDVTLAAGDLASFRWNWYEYVCCRPYPNYGHVSLVVDLDERRIIEVAEIVDLERLDEIHAIWLEQASGEEVLPVDYLDWSGADGPAFSSLALTPTGVEFGTDRLGAIGGTTTVVPFEALGDLVNPDFVARARAGTTPTRLVGPLAD